MYETEPFAAGQEKFTALFTPDEGVETA